VTSLGAVIGNPAQAPFAQVSSLVHGSWSSQPPGWFTCSQPLVPSHESAVQGFASSQSLGAPVQVPPLQASFVVQASESSQAAVFGVLWHPLAGAQESSVQGLLSLQLTGGPRQFPWPSQRSPKVQASWSLQSWFWFVALCWHPVPGLQKSWVQELSSSQSITVPAQPPFAHVPLGTQSLLHGAVLFAFTHPEPGAQESSVQGLLSLQSIVGPARHVVPFVPPHESGPLHRSPSKQREPGLTAVCTHPVAGTHVSSVQSFPSLHWVAPEPWQCPRPSQTSPVVQAFPSLHAVPELRLVWRHPCP
jgi:hypothetical protein